MLVKEKNIVANDYAVPQDEQHVIPRRIIVRTELEKVPERLFYAWLGGTIAVRWEGRIVIVAHKISNAFSDLITEPILLISPKLILHQVSDEWIVTLESNMALRPLYLIYEIDVEDMCGCSQRSWIVLHDYTGAGIESSILDGLELTDNAGGKRIIARKKEHECPFLLVRHSC